METTQTAITQPEYCSHSGLSYRGWTEAAIKRFLGHYDKEAPNPHYTNGYPMRLYLLERVEKAEKSPEYQIFCNKNKKKRDAAKKAADTKKNNLMNTVASWEIYINRQNIEDINRDAIESYNSILVDRSDEGFPYNPASEKSDKEFLNRITVNFLRHRCTSYETKLDEIAGKVGTKEAYILLNQIIYRKISETYPDMKSECDRQLERKIFELLEEKTI